MQWDLLTMVHRLTLAENNAEAKIQITVRRRKINDSLTYLLTYSMEQSPSLVKKFPAILWNPKVHYRITSARYLSLSRGSLCEYFVTRYVFTVRSCQHLAQPPSWRTTPCQLSQLSSMLEAVPSSAT
jgi:hypothetical protein